MAYQEDTADFDGTQDWVDIAWPVTYANFKLYFGLETTDGSAPGIRLTNPSNPSLPPTGASVRVEPTARFSGRVNVVSVERLP